MDRSVALLDRQRKVSGERRVPLTRGWFRHLFRTCGRPPSDAWSQRAAASFASGGDEGHLKVSQRRRRHATGSTVRRRGSPSLQNHSSTALAENYTSSSQPPRNRIVTTPPELPVSDPGAQTSKLHFRSD